MTALTARPLGWVAVHHAPLRQPDPVVTPPVTGLPDGALTDEAGNALTTEDGRIIIMG